MPSLIAKPATDGLLPLTHGTLSLSDAAPERLTSVAPLRGKEGAVAAALKKMGLTFPAPNRVVEGKGARIVWTGPGQAMLIGADPAPLAGLAALSDQSDAWAVLRLDGAGSADALARLVPIDLRPVAFGPGAAARAPLKEMMAVLMRAGEGIEIMVFRSMARSAVHEIGTAMAAMAARAGG